MNDCESDGSSFPGQGWRVSALFLALAFSGVTEGVGADNPQKATLPTDIRSMSGVPAASLIANPTFADGDGDGKPDNWEVKTFVLENFKKVPCISMKVPRKDKSGFIGEVSTAFLGPEGYYRVTVNYLDENDGVSKVKLLVNGRIIRIWNFDGTFGDCWRDEVIENVELAPGDKITLWGRDNPSEYCRIRSLKVVPSPVPPTPQEIAERETPPVIVEKEFGPLVALNEVRDLAAEEDRSEQRPLILGGSILFMSDGKTGVDLTLNQPRAPKYSLFYHGQESTGRDKVLPLVKDEDLPYEPNTRAAVIHPPPDGQAGLYELRTSQGIFAANIPHVLAVGSRTNDSIVAAGVGAFYFFVPRGTTAFGIGAYCNGGYIAEVAVNAPDGSLVTRMDVPNDAPQGIPIRVRPGQDDRVWSVNISGVSPKIRLCGIPPYVATHPRYLLVPRECIASTKGKDRP